MKTKPARAKVLSIVDAQSEYNEVVEKAAAEDRLIVIKISAKFCRACKVLEPKYQRVANTWTNIDFHVINFEDNREFCQEVLGITKLPWTLVLAPSVGHSEVVADGSSIGKLESSLRQKMLEAEDDFGI